MKKIQLMDKDNNIIKFDHSVDAREALISGNFFEISEVVTEVKRKEVEPDSKKKTVKVPEAEEKKTVKVPEPEVPEFVDEVKDEEK